MSTITRATARDLVRKALAIDISDEDFEDSPLAEFLNEWKVSAGSNPAASENAKFDLRIGRYVVPEKDLDFFGAISKLLPTYFLIRVGGGDLKTETVTTAIVAIASLLYNAYRNGVTVSPLQARIMAYLEMSGPCVTVEQLWQWLAEDAETMREENLPSKDLVESELRSLSQMVSRSGKKELVYALDANRWCLTDVAL